MVAGGAVAVFGIEKGPSDGAVGGDDVGGAEGKHSFVVVGTVVILEAGIRAHCFFDAGNHLEDGAVFLGDLVVEIGEDLEPEGEFLGVGEGLVGEFGSEGEELASGGSEVVEAALIFCQGEVAVRTPGTAIPSEDDRAVLKDGAEGDFFASGVFKGEVGGLVADVEGFGEDAGLGYGVDAELVLGRFLGSDSFFKIGFAGI